MSHKGPHRKPPKHSPYAGRITCLRCEREFHSWDRRQNRLCVYSREAIEEAPSEETTRPLPPFLRRLQHGDDE